jgi:hypothetical protein
VNLGRQDIGYQILSWYVGLVKAELQELKGSNELRARAED